MARYRFVRPEVVKLDLSDGDWLEAKRSLSYAEAQKLSAAGLTSYKTGDDQDGGAIGIDWARVNIARILTWVTDWSFRDEADKPVPFGADAVANLDPDAATEILEALDAHIEATEAEKKATPAKPAAGRKSG